MTTLEKINEKLDALKAKREELLKEIQQDFPALFQPLFEKSEKINSIGWKQYTPYWNDGEECEFSVHSDYPYVNGFYVEDIEGEENIFDKELWVGGDIKYKANPHYNEKEAQILEEFKTLITEIPEDFHKGLFGDHKQITLHRDGRIEVVEYDHE